MVVFDMPNHTLEIHSLGPIQDCKLTVNEFTVLTGPQSNGKSTIAKAVFFFRTVKQDILDIIMQGGPRAIMGLSYLSWENFLKVKLQSKFLQLFGTSWIMPDQMKLRYTYTSQYEMRVFLKSDGQNASKHFIDIEFSPQFQDYLKNLEERSFENINAPQRNQEEKILEQILDDSYETVFIPAGRNLITLLTAQLNYIFTSLDTPNSETLIM